MERTPFDMSNLFLQLGEASDADAINRFIETHSPLAGSVKLHEASFWTPAQAGFLREAIVQDAEWAEVVDTLNSELHTPH